MEGGLLEKKEEKRKKKKETLHNSEKGVSVCDES